jgi:hypothetical protein
MAATVQMKNSKSGVLKAGFYGFSWTSFFFGGIPALIRGDLMYGLGILVASIVLGLFSFGLLSLVVNIVWAFVYNKNYTHRLLEAGFEFSDDAAVVAAAKTELGVV